VRVTLIAAKNLLGAVLIAAGVAMIFLPGQGLATILIGVMLMDFPGKRRLEVWLISRRPVHKATTWIRARRGRPPLRLPDGVALGGRKDS